MRIEFVRRHPDFLPALLAALLAAGVLVTAWTPARQYCAEARRRAAVAADLVAGYSRGNQGLVGSLNLAPLPTVLVVLGGLVPFVPPGVVLNAVVAAAAAAALAAYVAGLWRRHGVPAVLRYAAAPALLLAPPVAMSIQGGQSTMLFICLAACGAAELTEWLRRPSLRALALSAILLALACVCRYQGIVLVAAGVVLVVLASALAAGRWRFVEATVITFSLPTAYVLFVWAGGNWLILGNPLFFLRAVTGPLALGTLDWPGVLTQGCPWLLLGSVLLFALSAPLADCVWPRPTGSVLPGIAASVAVCAAVALAWLAPLRFSPEPTSLDVRTAVRLLEARHPNGTFIVTGYSGYEFVRAAHPDPEHRWVHVMHLQPAGVQKVLMDYPANRVFLIVGDQEDRERWDEVGLQWRRPASRIPERFLFADRVGPWTVFEALRSY
jgi:hypothetical protein